MAGTCAGPKGGSMERPSHIAFEKHQPWSRRLPFLAMAISLQLAGLWLFTHGQASHLPTIVNPFTYVPVAEKQQPPVKPPEPEIVKKLKVIEIPPPIFGTDQPPKPGDGGIRGTLQTSTGTTSTKPPEHLVRAAVGIVPTHTVPPYPPVALRMDAEGKVTLRLNVSAEGRVTRADVVTSSGREDLDRAAQTWITAHWAYRPAQDNGVAVASQVLAVVTFSLSNPR